MHCRLSAAISSLGFAEYQNAASLVLRYIERRIFVLFLGKQKAARLLTSSKKTAIAWLQHDARRYRGSDPIGCKAKQQ